MGSRACTLDPLPRMRREHPKYSERTYTLLNNLKLIEIQLTDYFKCTEALVVMALKDFII